MSVRTVTALITVFFLQQALSNASIEARDESNGDVLDAFQVFANCPEAVLLYDNDETGSHLCLTTARQNFDENGPTATYVWQMKGLNGHAKKNITFHLKPGQTPDEAVFWLDADEGKEQVARLVYADYKSCGIFLVPLNGMIECMLWVTEEVKDNVPQYCIDQYDRNCDTKILEYSKDICSQVDSGV
uniref:Putative lipocalin-2 1 n=1 Tax=Amblyomma triste TaxID=251400 RepID=A0A023GCZ8_AMBTT